MGQYFALISNVLHLVLRIGRQEHLEQLLEGLLQSLENVGDSNVSKPFLEQDEVTVSAFAVGRGLVIEAGEVIGCEPVSKGFR